MQLTTRANKVQDQLSYAGRNGYFWKCGACIHQDREHEAMGPVWSELVWTIGNDGNEVLVRRDALSMKRLSAVKPGWIAVHQNARLK